MITHLYTARSPRTRHNVTAVLRYASGLLQLRELPLPTNTHPRTVQQVTRALAALNRHIRAAAQDPGRCFGPLPLLQATSYHLEWLQAYWRESCQLSKTSYRGYLAVVKRAFALLREKGLLSLTDPVGLSLRVPAADSDPTARGLTEQEKRVLEATFDRRTPRGRWDYFLYRLLCRLGPRAGEILAVQVRRDLHLPGLPSYQPGIGPTLHIPATKQTGKESRERELPLGELYPELVAFLNEFEPRCFLFERQLASRNGGVRFVRGEPMGYDALWQRVHSWALRAGLGEKTGGKTWRYGFFPHVGRFTMGCDQMRETGDIREVQDLMGHREVRTTLGYLKVEQKRRLAQINARYRDNWQTSADRILPG